MADKQIHELTAITRSPESADVLALDTGSMTGKMTYSTFKTAVNADVLDAVDGVSAEVDSLADDVGAVEASTGAMEEKIVSLNDTVGSYYPVFEVGAISGSSGNNQSNTARARTADHIPVDLLDRIFPTNTAFMFYVYCYDANKAFIKTYSNAWYYSYMKLTNLTFTVDSEEKVCKYIRLVICHDNGSHGTDGSYNFTNNIPVMPVRIEKMGRMYETLASLDARAVESSAALCGNTVIPWSGDGYVSIPIVGGSVGVPVPETLQDKRNYKYSMFPCEPGDEFEIMGVTDTGAARAWAFLDANGVVLDRAGVDGRTTYLRKIAPKDAAYLLINQLDTTLPSYKGYFVRYAQNTINGQMQSVDTDTSGHEALPFTGYGLVPEGDLTIPEDKTIFDAASLAAKLDTSRQYTLIECEPGATYTISGAGGGSSYVGYYWRSWTVYAPDGTTVRRGSRGNVQNTQVTVPDMECYLLINSRYGWRSYKGWMDSAALPDYYFAADETTHVPYLQERVNTIQGHMDDMGMNGMTLAFITDMHAFSLYVNGSIASPNNGLRGVKLLQYMRDHANVGMIFNGGDLFSGGTDTNEDEGGEVVTVYPSADDVKRTFAVGRAYLEPVWDDMFYILGNHEWDVVGTDSIRLASAGCMYGMFIGDKVRQYGGTSGYGDYYVDNPVQKIRFFCFNAGDGSNNVGIRSPSIRWFGDCLDEIPSGYLVVVISHLAINGSGNVYTAFEPVVKLMEMAKAKVADSVTIGGETVLYDYRNFAGKIGFVMCGHVHVDASGYSSTGNIPLIATTCDRVPKTMDSKTTIGTVNEGAFDVVQIDRANNKVYFTRIGRSLLANPDREFDF